MTGNGDLIERLPHEVHDSADRPFAAAEEL